MAEEEPAKPVRTDPLTSATRTTKRNLLLVAVATITYKAFDITVDKIPVAGITINFDKGVFEFLLLIVLAYFLVSFFLYYYIDIKNFDSSPHQDEIESWRAQRLLEVIKRTEEEVGKLGQVIDGQHRSAPATNRYMHALRERTKGYPSALVLGYRLIAIPLKHESMVRVIKTVRRGGENRNEDIETPSRDQQIVRAEVAATLSALTRKTLLRYFISTLKSAHLVWRVRLAYAARNYGIDGAVPILLAIFALLGLYEVFPLQWLQSLSPRHVTAYP